MEMFEAKMQIFTITSNAVDITKIMPTYMYSGHELMDTRTTLA